MDEKSSIGEKAKLAGGGIAVILGTILFFGFQLLILGAVVTIALALFRWVFG